ncbi:alpha/beta hydrolase fold domain-containing protein [Sphaerisporangium sp. NPDC005288]|uniref:alpha/beta hydrolase family protein n=1 Tax=Sphaerisporangium sp. NPDC005288 TaxID=3155114 RepID=UPI0033B66649
MRVHILIGPGVLADAGLLEDMAAREFAALGVEGRLVVAADVASFRAELDATGDDQAVVAMPGPDPDARRLIDAPPACSPRTVWLDLARVGPLQAAGGAAHLQGRGVWGLTWAIRHAVHRLRTPAVRIPYGDHPDQWGELRLPSSVAGPAPWPADTGVPSAGGSLSSSMHAAISAADGSPSSSMGSVGRSAGGLPPVAVLVHGGYWRSIWQADLMDALAIDLARRGYATWNLEYRRPDLHGWDATTRDVASGLAALTALGVPLDLDRVVVLGHSAGGQLALRLAADAARSAPPGQAAPGRPGMDMPDVPDLDMAEPVPGKRGVGEWAVGRGAREPRVAFAVSLAGVLDLVEADRRRMGVGAVAAALGGDAHELPEVYAAASPLARLPLGVPHLVVQGTDDDPDLVDIGRRYARAAGPEAVHVERPGDHFAVIDPDAPIWHAVADHLADHLPARTRP